ncbi:hypothetical protein EDD15DRAFT_2587286 [Pisolithus albus]|nr:hypothetical protein EDD15DRAFT_2587286 [Pisolithus albus]
MSAALLGSPGQLHVFEDDIESFVHVLGWTVLSYLPSPMDKDDRAALVSYLYDHSWKTSSGEKGGLAKEGHFKSGDYPSKYFTLTEPSPILGLIRNLVSPFRARYGGPPPEEHEELYKVLMPLYRLALERLGNSEWFLATIQDTFERPGWPAKDRAGAKLTISTEDTARQGDYADFAIVCIFSRGQPLSLRLHCRTNDLAWMKTLPVGGVTRE